MTLKVQNVLDSIELASSNLKEELNIKSVCAEDIMEGDFKDVDVLINTLGSFYKEESFDEILNFYNKGGIILNIGYMPFSVPYTIKNDKALMMPQTVSAIRSLKVVDYFPETGAAGEGMKLKVLNSKYNFINEIYNVGEFPKMSKTCSVHYNLVENKAPDDSFIVSSQYETACGWYSKAGELVAIPISRVDHFIKGSLIFLNFTPTDQDYYNKLSGIKLLSNIIGTALRSTVNLEICSSYAMYYEDETPMLQLRLTPITKKEIISNQYKIKIQIFANKNSEKLLELELNSICFKQGIFDSEVELKDLNEGFYKVVTSVYQDNNLIAQKNTGFYKHSKKFISNALKAFKPIYIDNTKSPDFCLQDGMPFAMHGTTYFVTDKYRKCFINFNAYQCDVDLKELKEVGFNILRSGNWELILQFYDEEGNINEKSARALEAYFYTASKYGLPVQFVFGNVTLNNWDRLKCPVHNPQMRKKVIRVFECFSDRFKEWPNVMVDIINEPSYSYAGGWTLGRPSGDKYELENWICWLKKKYNNDIVMLRQAWGINVSSVKTFDDAYLPREDQFSRNMARTEKYIDNALLTDFFDFARESYSNLVAQIYNTIKSRAPKLIVMMGRDEDMRIPSEQDEAYKGNIDVVNWHQWGKNSIIFAEYFLNRVRGIPCCGQELGVYIAEDNRGTERYDANGIAGVLEKKLLYSFGNWIQWQSFSDPFENELTENTLGLYRADRTATASVGVTRLLSWIEGKTHSLMSGRNEDAVEILTLHPTNYYFSVDRNLASQGIRSHILALHYHLKMQSDMVLEHLFKADNLSQIGKPKLIILPAAQMLSEATWTLLKQYISMGKTVLISGTVDVDNYWRKATRFCDLGIMAEVKPIFSEERLHIGDYSFNASFRKITAYADPAHTINKASYLNGKDNLVRVFNIGKGKLIHCPLPLELSDSIEPLAELYRFAIKEAGITNTICKINEIDTKPNLMVYPIPYENCTVYTIVNEGEDDSINFTDLASGAEIKMNVKGQRGCKIWIDKKGKLLGAYIHDVLSVNGLEVIPNGDLSIFKENNSWVYIAGKRMKNNISIGSCYIDVDIIL